MQSQSLKFMLAAVFAAGAVHAAPPQQSEALSAAQRNLAGLATHAAKGRSGVPAGELPFGLATNEPGQARIAYGFPVYTVDPEVMLSGGTLDTLAKPNGQWRFVISVRGKPVGLATVELVNGKYETVAYGAAELAKDIDGLFARHGNAARSNLRFVRVYQSRADLLEVSGPDGRARYAPLQSARAALSLQRDELLEASALMEPLRAAARANINAFR
jgi:hypothetical protein